MEARIDTDGRIAFRSEALLTGYATEESFEDPKIDGWFKTPDVGTLEGRGLRVAGRSEDFIKIGGESVDLSRLDRILGQITPDAAVIAVPDDRLGHVIHLVVATASDQIVQAFNERVLPFERARGVHRTGSIPRTALGKLRRAALAAQIAAGGIPPGAG
jgi:O-succinylbenzoic acid--CoA ligase